jgi:hypothetical protein
VGLQERRKSPPQNCLIGGAPETPHIVILWIVSIQFDNCIIKDGSAFGTTTHITAFKLPLTS